MHAKRRSRKQEERAAEELGGKAIPNSGAVRVDGGGDVSAPAIHAEMKFTKKDHYVLKSKDLELIRAQALRRGKHPVFQFEFIGGHRGTYAVLPRSQSEVREAAEAHHSLAFHFDETYRLKAEELFLWTGSGVRVFLFNTLPHVTRRYEVLPWARALDELRELQSHEAQP